MFQFILVLSLFSADAFGKTFTIPRNPSQKPVNPPLSESSSISKATKNFWNIQGYIINNQLAPIRNNIVKLQFKGHDEAFAKNLSSLYYSVQKQFLSSMVPRGLFSENQCKRVSPTSYRCKSPHGISYRFTMVDGLKGKISDHHMKYFIEASKGRYNNPLGSQWIKNHLANKRMKPTPWGCIPTTTVQLCHYSFSKGRLLTYGTFVKLIVPGAPELAGQIEITGPSHLQSQLEILNIGMAQSTVISWDPPERRKMDPAFRKNLGFQLLGEKKYDLAYNLAKTILRSYPRDSFAQVLRKKASLGLRKRSVASHGRK